MSGTEARSILEMSDEEILALDPAILVNSNSETTQDNAQNPADADTELNADDSMEDNSTVESGEGLQSQSAKSDDVGNGDEGESLDPNAAAGEGAAADLNSSEEGKPGVADDKGKPAKAADPKNPSSKEAIDYEAAYKQLTAPFKANGREIQVKDVNDAISLMQMGANYTKKMSALKPNLKLLKMLENNGLLSEEKLSFLIDLEKKNPDAINKLIKDSGVDPLDLDATKAGDYKPARHTVDDREMELDAVLEEIQHTDSYAKTINVVSNEWDGPSKNIIANSPQILKVINSHIQTGVYDVIVQEVEREKMFGRLSGLSDIEAYRQVGDAIQARGGFDHLVSQGQRTQPKTEIVQPKPKMGDEGKRREKKLAAATSQAAVPSKTAEDFNPLALSDDEFSKVVNQRFL